MTNEANLRNKLNKKKQKYRVGNDSFLFAGILNKEFVFNFYIK